MKKRIILISFIAVIATGIAVLYVPRKSDSNQSVNPPSSNALAQDTSGAVVTAPEPTPVVDEIALPEETVGDEIPASEPVSIPTSTPTPAPTPVVVPTTPPAPVASQNTYTDGTYSSTMPYKVPEGGNEGITISLTLKDDIVTGMTYSASGNKGESKKYQNRFGTNIENLVIGEPIDSITLSRVGGASLTTRAFNKAVDEIQIQAQV